MKLFFYSLSSGSSGNCYYVGNVSRGILIDAGISERSIRTHLKKIGIPIQSIMGVLVTHKHSDHARGVEVLARKNHIPVFTTQAVWKSLLTPHAKLSKDHFREIPLQKKFVIAGFDIEAFPVQHDAPETIGFQICTSGKTITIATDLGTICQTAAPYIMASNLLVLESNYDEQMLTNGQYPAFLKARIRSDHGHLGNHQASAFLAENLNSHLTNICLAHLSVHNNTPQLALDTLHQTFSDRGISLNGNLRITVLSRNVPSEVIRLVE